MIAMLRSHDELPLPRMSSIAGPNRRRQERERARALEEQRQREVEARQVDIAEAVRIVEAWNAKLAAGRRILFSPTIGAAIISGHRWLTVLCPACGTVNEIDVGSLGRHPDASIMSLIPALSCRACRPHAPFAQLRGLARERMAHRHAGGDATRQG
jgi:hypothetical protein